MRVLFIARYLQMVNHRKVMALAAYSEVELWHIAPRRWSSVLGVYEQELQEGFGYNFLTARAFRQGDIHRFVYWPPTLFINKIRPDIVHIEEEPDSLAALQAVLARRVWAPRARLVLFTWQNIRRPRHRTAEHLTRITLSQVDHMIAGNREAVEVLRQQGYSGPVTVLPQLGVDEEVFKPQNVQWLHRKLQLNGFVIGYVGRFVPEKGLDTLIKAAATIQGSHLLLIGRGPIKTEIESLAHSLGLADRLTLVDTVPHHEVPLYLNAMDVFVLPSVTTPKWKEQFGHVLIEAMACGTPVIGSDSGAIPEVIASAGLIFPEGNVGVLVSHVQRLMQNKAELQMLSQRGVERVTDFYTHKKIAERTIQIYRGLI